MLEVVPLGWLLDRVVHIVHHYLTFDETIGHDDRNHDEPQYYAAMRLQFRAAILEQNLDILMKQIALEQKIAQFAPH